MCTQEEKKTKGQLEIIRSKFTVLCVLLTGGLDFIKKKELIMKTYIKNKIHERNSQFLYQ